MYRGKSWRIHSWRTEEQFVLQELIQISCFQFESLSRSWITCKGWAEVSFLVWQNQPAREFVEECFWDTQELKVHASENAGYGLQLLSHKIIPRVEWVYKPGGLTRGSSEICLLCTCHQEVDQTDLKTRIFLRSSHKDWKIKKHLAWISTWDLKLETSPLIENYSKTSWSTSLLLPGIEQSKS